MLLLLLMMILQGLLVHRPSISSLLQSATAYFTKSAVVCYYKVRQVLLQSAIGIKKCHNFITKCHRTESVALKPLVWYCIIPTTVTI